MSQHNNLPIFPKATCMWLLENTALTFKQIADFCGMHELEVKGMADGEVGVGISPIDPISTGQLTKEEIDRCTNNSEYRLKLSVNKSHIFSKKKKAGAKYTPIARRQDKPNAVYWLLKHYPNMPESKIIKLIGTTKATIAAIQNRSHWNIKNIKANDPVLLGLTTQTELDLMVESLKPVSDNKNN